MGNYYTDRDEYDYDDRAASYYNEGPPLWRRPIVLGALLSIAVFCTVVWVAYNKGVDQGAHRLPPLVQADPTPAKVPPEKPGGLEVPHQDRLIYGQLSGKPQAQSVEQLLPPPEEPVDMTRPSQTEPPASASVAEFDPEAITDPVAPPVQAKVVEARPLPDSPLPAAPNAPTRVDAAITSMPAGGPTPLVPGSVASAAMPASAGPPSAMPGAVGGVSPWANPDAMPTGPARDQVAALEPPRAGVGGSTYFVQLGAVRNQAEAQAEWKRISQRMPDVLGGQQPVARRADLGAKGIYYRLQTGPFPDRSSAIRACEQIRTRGQGCLVVTP